MASETFRIAIDATVNDNTGPGVQSAQKRLSGFDKSIEHTKDRLDRLTSTGFHIDLDAVDRATATIQNVETKVHGFVGKAWNFTVGIMTRRRRFAGHYKPCEKPRLAGRCHFRRFL